jgi:5-histidylcysteine sulfoxide synthase/putative 4-mercaptohistidine N1-methyltranferase
MSQHESSTVTPQVPSNGPLKLVTKTPLLNEGDPESKRQEILEYFHDSFTLYESLFECLAGDEGYYARGNMLRHPLIFYYGHTAVFFINKLNVANLIDQRINPKIESNLAIGVDEMSWDDLNDKNYDWPTPAEVKAYRDKTRAVVDKFIRECDFSMPINWESPMWIILMGIEHERIHLETSSVLIRELPLKYVQDHDVWGRLCDQTGSAPANELIEVAGGEMELGKSKTNEMYGWDNEYGYSREEVAPFKASKYLVSNQEFLEFVEADGYATEKFWTAEGWHWATFRKAAHPVFWVKDGEDYRYRSMLSVIDMPWNWPAEINYLEAKAFCNWKSEVSGQHVRMPTEAEWHQLRNSLNTDQPFWDKAPGNINLECEMSPCPVDRHEFHDGFHDIIGNVWQWTETPIDGFDGFEVHPTYDDFSAPTFDGKHHLFKGGCWISTGNYAIKDARYAFRRHFFQHSGLRYVQAEPIAEPEVSVYETDQMVSRYIEFHYGESHLDVPNFPVACIQHVAKQVTGATSRALDIGCATARSAFELAKQFEHVDAVDFSVRLIEAPTNLQNGGKQRYSVTDEGELQSLREIRLEDFPGYVDIKDRIRFMQGDACNLDAKYSDYDVVFAGNLLDRLYDPAAFLRLIKERVNAGGLIALASPYTWLEEHTPREKWLGGFKAATGENFSTHEGIADILAPEFTSVSDPIDVPFVIRETRRKYQYGVSQLSIWRKTK